MEMWNRQTFWHEFAPPVLVAAALMWALAMLCGWAWKRDRKLVLSGLIFLVLLTVIGLVFSVVQLMGRSDERPYFTRQPGASIFRLQEDENNLGNSVLLFTVRSNDRPTTDVISQIIVLNGNLQGAEATLRRRSERNANALGSEESFRHEEIINLDAEVESAFVVFEMQYKDVMTELNYDQIWFMKLTKLGEGNTTPILFDATNEERTGIEQYLRQHQVPLLSQEGGSD